MTSWPNGHWTVDFVWLLPAYRGRGLATWLLTVAGHSAGVDRAEVAWYEPFSPDGERFARRLQPETFLVGGDWQLGHLDLRQYRNGRPTSRMLRRRDRIALYQALRLGIFVGERSLPYRSWCAQARLPFVLVRASSTLIIVDCEHSHTEIDNATVEELDGAAKAAGARLTVIEPLLFNCSVSAERAEELACVLRDIVLRSRHRIDPFSHADDPTEARRSGMTRIEEIFAKIPQ
jgi:hypothetical protein